MATSTNYTSIAYVLETTEGEAPDVPFAFQLLPTTGGSPVSNLTTAVSEVIRSDRQTDDLVVVDADISGEVNYELSYDAYQPLIIALMQNENAAGSISEIDLTATGATDKLGGAASGIDGLVDIGDVFRLNSSTEEEKIDGLYTCIDNTTTDEITIYPSYVNATAAASDVTIKTTSIVYNGSDTTPPSYTFRKTAENEGSTYYWYYHGCRINTMNFNFATGSILNGSVGVVGRTEDARTTKLDDENVTDTAIAEYNIMNSVNSIGTIYVEGIVFGTCKFSSLNLSIDNQTEAAKSIGTLGACATASYSIQITGDIEVFFKDLTMYDKFVAAESFGITIILDDDASDTIGNSIGINMKKCKFETLDTPIGGKDAFLKQTGTFRALRDGTNDNMIKFSFIDAA